MRYAEQSFGALEKLPWPNAARIGKQDAPAITGEEDMLWTIAVVLVLLWLLGIVTSYTLSGFIHILAFLALAVILIRVIQGRKPLG